MLRRGIATTVLALVIAGTPTLARARTSTATRSARGAAGTSVLHAFVRATFTSRVTYAQVVTLRAERLPAGAGVRVVADGRGAPHVRRTLVARRAGALDLAPLFGRRRLYVGDRISVTIRHGGATRQYVYTIHARRVAVADRD